jgi:predicted permease
MSSPNPLWHRYLRFWERDPRADLDEELAHHLQARIDEYTAAGMNEDAARAEAERRLGDLRRVRAECTRIDGQLERKRSLSDAARGFLMDLRVALRQIRRQPAFTATAVVCLMLGIGATTAILSVADAVLFRPLPYHEPDRLVMVGEGLPAIGDVNFGTISAPDFTDYRTLDGSAFASSAVFDVESAALTGSATPERVTGLRASASLFRVLGVHPALGSDFRPDADAVGSPNVVIISDALWRRRFGGDPTVIGRAIRLDGEPWTVVGVMPPGFAFPLPGLHADPADYFIPFRMTPKVLGQRANSYDAYLIARLAPGVELERAKAAVNAIAGRIPATYPDVYRSDFRIVADAVPLRERLVSGVRRSLLVLLGAAGLVLLIACINVSGLLLARGATRRREISVRNALGATRGRLARQLLAESAVLVAIGSAGGLLLAHWGARALAALAPSGLLAGYQVGVDGRVLAATLAIAVAATVAFALAPAVQWSARALPAQLREEGRGASTGRARQRSRRVLVVSQIALALVLASGAGLLVRSFVNALRVKPGFEPARLLTFQVTLPAHRYPDGGSVARTERQLIDALASVPGVTRASAASYLPTTTYWQIAVSPEGVDLPNTPLVVNDIVHSGYFETMGIQLVQGRTFDARDVPDSPPVVIVDEQFAKKYFPGGNAVGRRLRWGSAESSDPWYTVIGVVRPVKARSLDEQGAPQTYFAARQQAAQPGLVDFALRKMSYVVRTAGDPLAMASTVRRVVRTVDAELPVTHIETGESLVARSLDGRRFDMLLLSAFAALALVLAAVGLYGLIAYSVVQRQREIGIRIAMGATPGGVVGLVLREGAWTASIGAALGVVGAVALTRVMRSLLFGVGAVDAGAFVAAIALLVSVALLASWLPARRAARVDPVEALR